MMHRTRGAAQNSWRNKMEKQIRDIVNLGIGAVKKANEEVSDLLSQAETSINDLSEKGASASDDTSLKIKELAQQAVDCLGNLQTEAENLVNQVKDQVESFTAPKAEEAEATA